MFPPVKKRKVCSICSKNIEVLDEKIQTEKHHLHKACFKCAICETPLMTGTCSMDDGLFHLYGPMWFCPAHMMLGSGEKLNKLKAKFGEPRA